eukprot:Clim_evm22s47 gene=Clim_evmTU22s47
MAEATMATSAYEEIQNVGAEHIHLLPHLSDLSSAIRRNTMRRIYSTRNAMFNMTYPAGPLAYISATVAVAALINGNHGYEENINEVVDKIDEATSAYLEVSRFTKSVAVVSLIVFALFAVYSFVMRFALKALLSYQGWLKGKPGIGTKIWGLCLSVASSTWPLPTMTYAFSRSLPSLPVPPLKQTVDTYLDTVKPLLSEEKFEETKERAKRFQKREGKTLQLFLSLRGWWKSNWLTDWWVDYVYLHGRTSLMINSNYYGMGSAFSVTTPVQTAKTASLIHTLMRWKRQIDRETLEPCMIRGLIPLCMNQYRRLFSTTRIPGLERDKLVTFGRSESQHIVVMRKNHFYALGLTHRDGRPLTPYELEKQLEWIKSDADKRSEYDTDTRDYPISMLTAWDRKNWARVRSAFLKRGISRASLRMIETAIFTVALDDREPTTLTEEANMLIHGDGQMRWFDKSFTLIVFENGRNGLNVEHAWADAPVMSHTYEWVSFTEVNEITYNQHGRHAPDSLRSLKAPVHLEWNFSADLKREIVACKQFVQEQVSDFEMKAVCVDGVGKETAKALKCSPDAFIQMAFQTAYRRKYGKSCLTYESSMTRLFTDGRTETIRSCSNEAAAFAQAMCDKNAGQEEKLKLLRAASDRHTKYNQRCMTGQAIDRHLFGLYVVAKGLGIEAGFLDEALSMPWKLSTSQVPQQQTMLWDQNDPKQAKLHSPGGGFGPVAHDGYGIFYMLAGPERIFFHISSKKSAPETASQEFLDEVLKALRDMAALGGAEVPTLHLTEKVATS